MPANGKMWRVRRVEENAALYQHLKMNHGVKKGEAADLYPQIEKMWRGRSRYQLMPAIEKDVNKEDRLPTC
eukprot:g46752.t1